MLFTRVSTCALFFLTFGFSAATPAKRDAAASVSTVLATLTGQTSSILPQIQALTPSNASTTTVLSLVSELTSAINTASTSLSGINSGGGLLRRQSSAADTAIANTVSGLIAEVAETLDSLTAVVEGIIPIGIVDELLTEIDIALNQVLVGLGIILDGILGLVADLVGTVVGLLSGLGLLSILGTLGL